MKKQCCLLAVLLIFGASSGRAQFNSGSDGSDLAFNPMSDVTIDLGLAATAPWNTPSPTPGNGVYDAEQWAVVFKYTTVTIPAGVTVRFANHPSGAPVMWLAQGEVSISGSVLLDGVTAAPSPNYSTPGPGGFAGGRFGGSSLTPATPGFGPGGGGVGGSGGWGAYGTSPGPPPNGATYGNIAILPLIGGSGGSGESNGGGAGGGAILIASSASTALALGGLVQAKGGTLGGSGGGIRLIANTVSGAGRLRAQGGVAGAGNGRIRVEASTLDLLDPGDPAWTYSTPGTVFPDASAPKLTATMVAGQAVPSDPVAGIRTVDVVIADAQQVLVNIEARNIPLGTTVDVHIVSERGGPTTTVTSTPLAGSFALSTATAAATFPPGAFVNSEVYLRANWTPTAGVTGIATWGQRQ